MKYAVQLSVKIVYVYLVKVSSKCYVNFEYIFVINLESTA